MGCLRLTYEENESPLRVSRDEETVTPNWQVWTREKGENFGVSVVDQQSGGEARLAYAKEFAGRWQYGQARGTAGELNYDDAYCDCSEFVLRVLKHTDPDVYNSLIMIDAKGRHLGNTSTIRDGIARLGGTIRTSNPQVGDIAVWTGHVEFVESVNGNNFSMFGAGGSAAVPRSVGQGWLYVGSPRLNSSWNGTFLGFWTPPTGPTILSPVVIHGERIPFPRKGL